MSMGNLLEAAKRFKEKQDAEWEKENLESVEILRTDLEKTASYIKADGIDLEMNHPYFHYSFVTREMFEKINLDTPNRFKEVPEPEAYHGFWKYDFITYFRVKDIITEKHILKLLEHKTVPRRP